MTVAGLLAVLGIAHSALAGVALPTEITYQGQLRLGVDAVGSNVDLQFKLFDDETALIGQIGPTIIKTTSRSAADASSCVWASAWARSMETSAGSRARCAIPPARAAV